MATSNPYDGLRRPGTVGLALPGVAVDPVEIRAATSRHLAAFRRSKAVIVVDELPWNAIGKVQMTLLRTEYSHLFAQS